MLRSGVPPHMVQSSADGGVPARSRAAASTRRREVRFAAAARSIATCREYRKRRVRRESRRSESLGTLQLVARLRASARGSRSSVVGRHQDVVVVDLALERASTSESPNSPGLPLRVGERVLELERPLARAPPRPRGQTLPLDDGLVALLVDPQLQPVPLLRLPRERDRLVCSRARGQRASARTWSLRAAGGCRRAPARSGC